MFHAKSNQVQASRIQQVILKVLSWKCSQDQSERIVPSHERRRPRYHEAKALCHRNWDEKLQSDEHMRWHASRLGETSLFYDSFGPAKPWDLTSLWQSHCISTLILSQGDCTLRIKRIWLDLIRLDEALMLRQRLSSTASLQKECLWFSSAPTRSHSHANV